MIYNYYYPLKLNVTFFITIKIIDYIKVSLKRGREIRGIEQQVPRNPRLLVEPCVRNRHCASNVR